jgi:hypothetical protein
MKHILIFQRKKKPPYNRKDYKSISFQTNDEDLDLIQDLCKEWNNDKLRTTNVELMPIEMAILKHNDDNDLNLRTTTEAGLLRFYRGKRSDSETAQKILNLEIT